ncbi:hypothetical protein RyT2_20910 [Pseudolactococcus yaeyamensis]
MMLKLRIWITLENEERFINKYSKRGYVLKYIAPFRLMPPLEFRVYKFSVAPEVNHIYRIDYRSFDEQEDEQEYKQLMQDDGWHFFKNNYTLDNWYSNYYWYRERVSGDENIYSDIDSRLEASNRLFSRILMFSVLLLGFHIIFPMPFTTNSSPSYLANIMRNWYPLGLLLTITIMIFGKLFIFIQRRNSTSP